MLSPDIRFQRHFVLDQLGKEGQAKLQAAHVAIVGLGGLGSAVSLYLTAAGIGHFTLIDGDMIDESNLQRQVLYDEAAIGQKKSNWAKQLLYSHNSSAQFQSIHARLTDDNAEDYLRSADLVVDCTDNFDARFVMNRYCRKTKTPLIIGACTGYVGQVAVLDFNHADSPCYACLYPESPEILDISPATIGILSPLPGLIGCTEAIEAIQFIVHQKSALVGKLWTIDSRTMETRMTQLVKDEACHCQKT